jgi:hypothetical protein
MLAGTLGRKITFGAAHCKLYMSASLAACYRIQQISMQTAGQLPLLNGRTFHETADLSD